MCGKMTSFFPFLLAFFLVDSVLAVYPSNMLQNSGFESSIPSAYWTNSPAAPPSGVSFAWDGSVYRSGTHSACISYTSAGGKTQAKWKQTVSIQENIVYEFSGYIKTTNVPNVAQFEVSAQDAEGNDILLETGNSDSNPNPYTHNEFNSANDWTKDMIRFIAPRGAAKAEISLMVAIRPGESGTVWCDDMYFGTPDDSQVSINISTASTHPVLGEIRLLQGLHGIKPNLIDDYQQLRVNFVRTHDGEYPDINGNCDFDFGRIFPNFSADETDSANYNFSDCDAYIANIYAAGAEPFFRLGQSWYGPNSPPSDFNKWAEVCKHIVMHYNDGWANGYNYNIHYWEIWNEPDYSQFWTGTRQQFFDLYHAVADKLKTYDPDIKVGGSGFAGMSWRDAFLGYCQTNSVPLDFLSWHKYSPHPYDFYKDDTKWRQALDNYGFTQAQSIQSEWNMYLAAPPETIDENGATYSAANLMYMQDSSIAIAIRWDGEVGHCLFDQADDSLEKPFYAHKAMGMMMNTPVRLNVPSFDTGGFNTLGYAVLAGKSTTGDTVQVLISDYSSGHPGYNLTVTHGFNGSYNYERYVIDATNNLQLVESGSASVNPFTLADPTMFSPSVQLIKIMGTPGAPETTNETPARLATDFDGDNFADPAVVSNGIWRVWLSTSGYLPAWTIFGTAGQMPVAADFDNDGLADPAMASSNGWYFWLSSAGYQPAGPYGFWMTNGIPVAGDFDGDSWADPAVVVSNQWYVWLSSGGYGETGPFTFGTTGNNPVSGDFDADGLTDPAIITGAQWTVWLSSLGYSIIGPVTFGIDGQFPVAADFDGDGKSDPAMIGDVGWHIWFSSIGYLTGGPYVL